MTNETNNGLRLPFTKKPIKMVVFERPEYRENMPVVNSSRVVYDAFKQYGQAGNEIFGIIYVDCHNQIIDVVEASEGTVDSANIYPREIMRGALILGATSVILFHNHPSGDPEPSMTDRDITKQIVWCGRVMGVKVLDHIIIAEKGYMSFSDRGLVDDYELRFTKSWEVCNG